MDFSVQELASLFELLALGLPNVDGAVMISELVFVLRDFDKEGTVVVFPLVAVFLPSGAFTLEEVDLLLIVLALVLPDQDGSVVSFKLVLVLIDSDQELTVLVKPSVVLLLEVSPSGLPVVDDRVVTLDGHFQTFNGDVELTDDVVVL